jgi:hypothetical protein
MGGKGTGERRPPPDVGEKKKRGWGSVTLEDLLLLDSARDLSLGEGQVHHIIPREEGGEAADSVFNAFLMFEDLFRYIEEFGLHHDPRVIRHIGPAYFLALDTCRMAVEDPAGWREKCFRQSPGHDIADPLSRESVGEVRGHTELFVRNGHMLDLGGAEYARAFFDNFNARDPRREIFREDPSCSEHDMSTRKEAALAAHRVMKSLRLAQAEAGTTAAKTRERVEFKDMKSKARIGLEALRNNRRVRAALPGFEEILRHIVATGEAALSASQNGDDTFHTRTVGLSLIGIQEIFVRNVPRKLLDSIHTIMHELVCEGLSGAIEKLEPGRMVLAQRFAIKYELVDRTQQSKEVWSCPIYIALEKLMGNEMPSKVKAVELVVLNTAEWSKGKGVRACAACQKSEADCELKSCARCKVVKYCSRDCQVGHWKAHKAICKALG